MYPMDSSDIDRALPQVCFILHKPIVCLIFLLTLLLSASTGDSECFPVSSDRIECVEGWNCREDTLPAMAFDGTNYLVVWQQRSGSGPKRNSDIYAQRVSPDGNLLGETLVICDQEDDQTNPDVAFDGTNFLIVWEDQRN
ncbi:MAG: hypothetical protein KGY41_09020, partial [Desulfovermiculus sp.]|nr:hypothetical protein [Desulfovermiculus sp.]